MSRKTNESGDAAVAAAAAGDADSSRPRSTPLPRKQMTVLTVVLITESVCGTMLLPFVPRFIAYLKHIPVEEAGYYTGMLVGLFMLGQVVSSKLWGWLSDTYGRKLPLVAGLLAGAVTMLFFGYTRVFAVCCTLRFLHGFFNGNVLVAKTMIADITDKTNEARGFALVSITWGVGTLFGPFIGGFLYNPTSKWYLQWLAGGSLRGFFDTYPAFLPSFTIFAYTMVSLVCCALLLEETNVHRRRLRDTRVGRYVHRLRGGAGAAATDVAVVGGAADAEAVVVPSTAGATAASGRSSVRRKLTYVQAMRIGALRNITLFYMLLAAADMTYGEILPLWGNAEGGVGGMGLTENAVAMLMLSYSVPSVVANLYFHHMCRFFDGAYLVFWRYSLSMFTLTTVLIPLGSRMGGAGYYYVMLLGMARQVGLSWCYSLIHMLTANAAPMGCVGAAYGISQSLASATRCVVPFVVAPLFAWSLRRGHVFPFNYYLVFLVAAVPAGASVAMSFYVQITRTEACEVDLEATAALDTCSQGGPHHRATGSDGNASGSSGSSGSGDESDESDGRESTYRSLVGSFCTNPLHDTYVDMPALERANAEAARQLRWPENGNSSSSGGVQSSGHYAEEDRRHAASRDDEHLRL